MFCCISCCAQVLHHQTLSSQGKSIKVNSNGITVSQSIGQISPIGNYNSSNLIVGQGFIQSVLMKTNNDSKVSIETIAYPNPFIDIIHFKFSLPVSGIIKFSLFDISGRLIFYKEKMAIDNVLTIDNLFIAQGEYLVKLDANKYKFSTILLK